MVPSGLQFKNRGNLFCFSYLLFQGVKVTEGHAVHISTNSSNTITCDSWTWNHEAGFSVLFLFTFGFGLPLAYVFYSSQTAQTPQRGIIVVVFSQSPTASILDHSILDHLYGELVHKTSILIFCCHFFKNSYYFFILANFNVKLLKWIPEAATVVLSGFYLPVLFPLRPESLSDRIHIFDFFSYS